MTSHLKAIFPASEYPDVLSGLQEGDDAAVYRLDSETALIFTTDFFTPVVDDPYMFGAVSAANALSDVYAMGGEVLLALNLCCFPEDMDEQIIRDILLGGAEKVREAGGVIAGGHTVDDKEPKYGLAVIGRVHLASMLEKSGAVPGDRLVLTKPLGAGVLTTALKADLVPEPDLRILESSMAMLNKAAAEAAREIGCRTATDVTGFGLIGHSLEIADRSHVQLEFRYDSLPFLPGVSGLADQWIFPAGSMRNRDAFSDWVSFDPALKEEQWMVLMTPETSGGLLLVVPPDRLTEYLETCRRSGVPAVEVGLVKEGSGISVVI